MPVSYTHLTQLQFLDKAGKPVRPSFYTDNFFSLLPGETKQVVIDTSVDKVMLNLDEEFHLKMIGLKRANKITNCLGISLTELHVKNELPGNEKVEEGDELVCYGRYRDFQAFWKAI